MKTIKRIPARAIHRPGVMNKTEEAYGDHLSERQARGEIREYHFEAVKLRLAKNCTYTPDFMVISADGTVEMHEVKGFWRDDARVKIKVAAAQYPFVFLAVKKKGRGWETETIQPRGEESNGKKD